MQIAKQAGSACRAEVERSETGVIRIAGIVKNSIVDGPGLRFAVFGQGCPLKCPDCHNPDTHDFFGGELMEIADIAEQIKSDGLLDGVTFTGGEPFAQVEPFSALADLLPEHNIICYSGYSFEELRDNPEKLPLLERIDILVDGRFESTLKTYDKRFRGSTNQKAIDIKESLKHGKTIEINL
jgi:anaerobic ribonucleoside-triphosphate reductase activating protein